MKKIVEGSIILGIVLGLQPATIASVEADIPENTISSTQVFNNQEYINPVPETEDPRIKEVVFDFDNAYDYGTCLDAILLAHENRMLELENAPKNDCANNIFSIFGKKLSQDTTLQLIQSADSYATQELGIRLYPSFGLRRRVAINLGYIYDIDRNNNDILKYVSYQTINQYSDLSQATNNQDNQEYVNSVPETEYPNIEQQIVFDFDNAYDYEICLDAILLAYENRKLELENAPKNDCANNIFSMFGKNLSKDTTLQLIQSADSYVTQELGKRLYPSLGLRRRIAINLGYIYDIDQKNDDILKYLSSNQ